VVISALYQSTRTQAKQIGWVDMMRYGDEGRRSSLR
jgi:hypothetical protein